MAVSNVSIVNRALTLLSVDRIQALDENSEQARKANAIFEDTRDALLEDHNWNFARTERVLSLVSPGPITETWANAFELPADCIRVIRTVGDLDFAIYGRKLYTNEPAISIEYIKKETDPAKFSKSFVKALASQLAADLAFGLTQNATLTVKRDEIAQRDVRDAKWNDSQEGKGIVIKRGSMINGD